jgi:hypothetical protein
MNKKWIKISKIMPKVSRYIQKEPKANNPSKKLNYSKISNNHFVKKSSLKLL